MTRTIEHSRRRGPFDPRYRVRRAVEEPSAEALVGWDEAPHNSAIRVWEDQGGAAWSQSDRYRGPVVASRASRRTELARV